MEKENLLPPGEYLKEELQKRGWTQADLAMILGKHVPAVNEVIQGKRAVTTEMAVALGTAFGTDPEIWMHRESVYRLSLIEQDPEIQKRARFYDIAPIKDMERRGWIGKSESVDGLEKSLLKFFDIKSLDQEPSISAFARQSSSSAALNPVQRAWCYRAKHLAKVVQANRFSEKGIQEQLPKLRKLTKYPENVKEVPKLLSEVGVRLVIVEHLAQSRIDGAAFWLDEKSPVVALSVRYDRIDCFWYTLCHELSHIIHKDSLSVDDALFGESKDKASIINEIEARADKDASNMLIPAEKLQSFVIRVKPFFSKTRIIQFAHRMDVHPGIVVGQLQHLGEITYATNREMLAKVRDLATSAALTDGWGKMVPEI